MKNAANINACLRKLINEYEEILSVYSLSVEYFMH